MATVVHVTVYESNIARDFQPGGQVYRHVASLARDNERWAKTMAPKRTGELAASIDHNTRTTGPFRCQYDVGTNLDRAHYVLRGTTGPITPKNGRYLWMRPAPFSWLPPSPIPGTGGRWPFASVSGQSANNFLARSIIAAFTAEGLFT